MNEDMTVTPVVEILQNVTYSVDFGHVSNYAGDTDDEQRTNFWIDVIYDKASDTGFGHLIDSILTNGWSDESAVGWYGGSEITEGHHRLVAAILLGMDEVPTTSYGESDFKGLCAHSNWSDPHGIVVDLI